jgi:hypothetical protein
LRSFSTARTQPEADATASGGEEDVGGEEQMPRGDNEDRGGEAKMASEELVAGCWGQAGTGGSSSFSLEPGPKTNLRSMSPHTEHWRVSCLKPVTIPASSGLTSAKIISLPHTMQRMTPTLANLDTPTKSEAMAGYTR